ncbi:MAG: hypothetical protein OHK93_008549 [Ramalina farinacea]|uniref:Uncharacterized protein n=1 Tax=Ramalina farinacea TaxID=258253 RepID=A0AA43TRZ9_9LECA|nr:hypothetical protein [Ramalina farinacea]
MGGPLLKTVNSSYKSSHCSTKYSTIAKKILREAITSVVVTLPCLWYLLQPQLQAKEHGGGHGHDEHGEHSEESHDEAEGAEGEEGAGESKSEDNEQENIESQEAGDEGQEKEEQGDQGDDQGGDQSADDSISSSGEGQDTPDTSEDEGSDEESSQGGKVTRNNNTVVTYPDAKGGIKKRHQSNNAKVLGKADSEEQDPDNEDMGASSKDTGDRTTQSGKQEGLSNTDTKHSVDISNDPDKSKKGEGVPETAKLKGTVDPNRPAR